ncbi:cell division protein ZapE [Leucobacter japonicus]|uniref:cell division protein ZapE n=1 Tax=Leucobacter japonicus TaxID=1461259 RepID=UPI0035218946
MTFHPSLERPSLGSGNVTETDAPTLSQLTDRVGHAAAARGIDLDAPQRELLTEIAELAEHWADPAAPVGAFVHGPAGRGKTWLMSEIFTAVDVPEAAKRRVHFHTFFQELQRRFGAQMTAREAIDDTVDELLDGAELFFFDELHVHDPGGASLLNRLIAELVERRIPTLFTSNYAPEGLLANPVFHHVVEPSVRLIREHFAVRTLDGGTDYRTAGSAAGDARPATGFASGRWIAVPTGTPAASAVSAAQLTPPTAAEATQVLDGHRTLRALAVRPVDSATSHSSSEIWFSFDDLLEASSIAEDFLDLAAQHGHWVLVGVPPLSRASREARQRFVALLDVLVHADLPLTVFASTDRAGLVDIADPPADLFRTVSRLALLGE